MSSKFYITTAIAYTNAPPHIGFALELCQADAIARYRRLAGDRVFFLTGTDEHGQKNAKSAAQAGSMPREFVYGMAEKFKNLAAELNISNDYFIRTSDVEAHWPGAQEIWRLLAKEGKLYRKNYQGLYCEGCEVFKKPSDLVEGKCADHRREPEVIEEENWFFRLSDYQKELELIIREDKLKIYPESRKNEVLAFMAQGLDDISFSRPSKDLSWGVPVPDDPTQTMYVWCDALTNYLTGIGYPNNAARFEEFWPADIHLIGKDILRFHAVIWPAMLLAVGLPLPRALFVHGHILSLGQKMSKSLGNVVDPVEVMSGYGTDALRYFLLKEIPPTQDGDFTHERFHEIYNADLVNGLGNLLARTLAMGEKYGKAVSPHENSQHDTVTRAWREYRAAAEEYRFPEALHAAWSLVRHANEHIDREEPWKLLQSHSDKLGDILADLVFLLGNVAWMLEPYLPATAENMMRQLGLSSDQDTAWNKQELLLRKGNPLFPRKDFPSSN